MKKVLFFLSALFALTFVGCSDDEDSKSATEILTSGKWYTESYTMTSTFEGQTDTDNLEDCEKDDYMEFKSNGTVVSVPGSVKCDSDDSNESGTWKLSDGDKKLELTMDGMPMIFTIESISDSKIVLSIETTVMGVTMKGKITVVKK